MQEKEKQELTDLIQEVLISQGYAMVKTILRLLKEMVEQCNNFGEFKQFLIATERNVNADGEQGSNKSNN